MGNVYFESRDIGSDEDTQRRRYSDQKRLRKIKGRIAEITMYLISDVGGIDGMAIKRHTYSLPDQMGKIIWVRLHGKDNVGRWYSQIIREDNIAR